MPSLLRKYAPTVAPAYAAQLDLSNPLTAGLFFAHTPRTLITPPTNAQEVYGTLITPFGPANCWTYTGAGSPIFTIPSITSAEWSFAMYAFNPSASGYKIGCCWYDSGAATLQALHLRVYNSGNIGADLRPQQYDFNGSLVWPQYETHLLGATISAAAGTTELWWDGRLDTSAAISSGTARTVDSFQLFAKEGANNADAADAGSAVMLALAWNRALGAGEWARLAANPWQIFQSRAELSMAIGPSPSLLKFLGPTGQRLRTHDYKGIIIV